MEREHKEKVAPKLEQPAQQRPAICLQRLLEGAYESLDIDCGDLFDLTGAEVEFGQKDKEALQSCVEAFRKEAAKAAKEAFGALAAQVKAAHEGVAQDRERLAAKKRRVDEAHSDVHGGTAQTGVAGGEASRTAAEATGADAANAAAGDAAAADANDGRKHGQGNRASSFQNAGKLIIEEARRRRAAQPA